jgi:HlyD family secretion protein
VAGGGFGLLRKNQTSNRDLSKYTTTVRQGSLAGVITASGEVEADRRVNVSPKRQGQLRELYVDEGDQVQAGQALARMDPSDILNRIEELKAQVQTAQIDVVRSRSEFERRRQLFSQGALSNDDISRYRASYDSSQAALAAVRCFLVSWGYLAPGDGVGLPAGIAWLEPTAFAAPLAQWP